MENTKNQNSLNILLTRGIAKSLLLEVEDDLYEASHPNYVNQVWAGERRSEKKKGQNIEVATLLLDDCLNQGIQKAKEIIGSY